MCRPLRLLRTSESTSLLDLCLNLRQMCWTRSLRRSAQDVSSLPSSHPRRPSRCTGQPTGWRKEARGQPRGGIDAIPSSETKRGFLGF